MKSIINLNGQWKFAPTFDQKPTNNHNVIESNIPLYAHEKLVRTGWQNVPVPGVWQKYAERYAVFEGVCWFFREFEADEFCEDTLAKLVFKGVNYRADVYINNQYVGFHESGYTEFSFDISAFLRRGKNAIAVMVDNRPTEVKWPNDWGYGVFGGIHRDVFIELYREEYITDIKVIPNYDVETKKGILTVAANVVGLREITVKLLDTETRIQTENGKVKETLTYDITPWTPKNPVLYTMEILGNDVVYDTKKIGFRNVFCKDKKFYLNGKESHFNGVCYLYDSPKYGLVMEKMQLRSDLQMMKDANINAIRTHYPMSDNFYALCDEMGFMVWIEPNIYCSKPANDVENTVFKQQEFVDVAVSMTREMVEAATAYASVVIYGIGNECNVTHPEALPFFEKIAQTVKDSDKTRLIGYASLYGIVGNISHLVDIMGINSYFGWYGTFDMFEAEDKLPVVDGQVVARKADVSPVHGLIEKVNGEIPEDVPILLTEFGGDSVPGYYSSASELWSENYHADVVREYIKAAADHAYVVGTFAFAFTDYSDPSKPLNGKWNGYNLKGMVTYEREIKLPYYAIKEAYSPE